MQNCIATPWAVLSICHAIVRKSLSAMAADLNGASKALTGPEFALLCNNYE